jgi:hypothetical protein
LQVGLIDIKINMRILIVLFLSLLVIAACNYSNSDRNVDKQKAAVNKPIANSQKAALSIDTTGFLSDCKKLSGVSIGGLQYSPASRDSTGFMGFTACYSCTNTYEIVFVLKGGVAHRKAIGYLGLEKYIDRGCDNKYLDFDCYVFQAPMRDPEKQDDIHAVNMDFPLRVKVYKRIDGDNWHFIQAVKVDSLTDYLKLQFNTIYSK